MASVGYDTLTIEIGANVSGASQGIKTLKNNLKALQKVVSNIDTGALTSVEKHLQKIANIDFSNVSKGLQDVVSAFRQLNSLSSKKVNFGISEEQKAKAIDLMTNYGKGFGEPKLPQMSFDKNLIPQLQGGIFDKVKTEASEVQQKLLDINKTIEDASQIVDNYDKVGEALKRAGLNSKQVEKVINAIYYESSNIDSSQIVAIENILKEVGYNADEVKDTIDRLKASIKSAGKEAEKQAKGGFQKLVSAFKRILFYRIVRRAIQLVGQAIKEGIQNITMFDVDFNKSMSEIKSSMTYFKNSFASLVAPIVEVIAPVLTMFTDLIANINNELGKMFAMLNGKNQFAKATKGAEDYAESLKKAKAVSLGIDELNVAQKENASGFENESINGGSGVVGNLFANLKEKLEPLIEQFKTGIMPLLQAFMTLFEKLTPIINIVINLITKLIGDTMGYVNKSITDLIKMLGSLIDFIGTIIKGLEPILNVIVDFIGKLINIFNESLSMLFIILEQLFSVLNEIFTEIFHELTPVIKQVAGIIQFLLNVCKGIIDVVKSLIGGVLTGIVSILKIIAPILQAISGALGANINERSTGERIFWGLITGGGSELLGALQNIGSHAQGGFVEDGFFYANHNELVGQFSNGQTAVANNAQIVEGIKQGVMDAIIESGGLGGSRGSRDIVIQIDGREIGRASEKYEAQKGEKIFSGGYHYEY